MSFQHNAALVHLALRILPEKQLSKGARAFASLPSKAAVRAFARKYNIDVDEAEKPLCEYPSVLDFFTRRLKPGARPLDPDLSTLLSPVDGALAAHGDIVDGELVQAKEHRYALSELLADTSWANHFAGGRYVTLYLSPRDYHRVHSPATGDIVSVTHVPGALFPVNEGAVNGIDQLFTKNERLVIRMRTPTFGEMAVVMVGATCVGHMRVVFDESIVGNTGRGTIVTRTYDPPHRIERGAELGVFELGSTVVLVVEPRVCLTCDQEMLRVGHRIGRPH